MANPTTLKPPQTLEPAPTAETWELVAANKETAKTLDFTAGDKETLELAATDKETVETLEPTAANNVAAL